MGGDAATPRLARDSTRPSDNEPRVIAGRYRLLDYLSSGGHSTVYRAADLLTSVEVAVKLLPALADVELERLRSEVSALRLLHLPGVSRLLDEGTEGNRPFLVMELVPGKPFPGRLAGDSWESIQDTVMALLETLARVHAMGVVHRDLKPANVLVDDDGRPTVLDFGLSAGRAIGSGLEPNRGAVGTPAYASPEQILGGEADARADLYSLGVMVYEALTGRLPQEYDTSWEVLEQRLYQPPRPLHELAPRVPPKVARLVDQLLALEARHRPRSAMEVLARLRGETTTLAGERDLPRLGGDEPLRRLARVASDGRSADLVGGPGTGRSRALRELRERLLEDGRRVVRIVAASEPLASLEPLGDLFAGAPPRTHEEALEIGELHLRRVLGDGAVVLVDEWEELDRWSHALLQRCRDAGCVIAARRSRAREEAAGAGIEVVRLEPLAEADLLPLFAGPDRIFHLREDGARELWLRTGGNPARIADEVAAWVRAGLADWSGCELAVDRQALDRLRAGLQVLPPELAAHVLPAPLSANLEELLAWIALASPWATAAVLAAASGRPAWSVEAELAELAQAGAVRRTPDGRVEALVSARMAQVWTDEERVAAHRRIARLLEPGTETRLFHLIAAGETREIPGEACELARRLVRLGRLGAAEVALTEGLSAVRQRGDAPGECAIFREWISVALADFTPLALDRVLYELSRAITRSAEVVHMEELVHAAVATLETEDALAEVEAVRPFGDLELERWRQGLRTKAARGCDEEVEERVLDEIESWADENASLPVHASLAEWLGRLRYRQERFDEAAELQGVAAELSDRVSARLSAMLNGASALMEAFRFGDVIVLATRARALAAACRHALYEARAEWLLRSADYRWGTVTEPDLELAEAAGRIGFRDQEALICLTEAAVAWRAEELELARDLADRAARAWTAAGKVWGALLARSLVLACGAPPEEDELEALADRAESCPIADVAAQSLALLRRAGLAPRSTWPRVAESIRAIFPEVLWSTRLEILSVPEVLEGLTVP